MKEVASIVFAAGKGSRMMGYQGNKTLLPLIPEGSLYSGRRPMLIEVLDNLPPGPKGIVVHHFADQVRAAAAAHGAEFIVQPETNGTGGALLAARSFLESSAADKVIITMGDVPLIRPATYAGLIAQLCSCDLAVLAFDPQDKAQYGLLECAGEHVKKIVEWKYWRSYPASRRAALHYCNAGVYAAGRRVLLEYMAHLAKAPHRVQKKWGGSHVTVEEFFLTDLVELMSRDGLAVGMAIAAPAEVTGVDTPEALHYVQRQYAGLRRH